MSAALAHPVYEGGAAAVTNGHANGGEVTAAAEAKIKKATASKEEADSKEAEQPPQEEEPEVDIVINNVVCSFNVRCHLNLRVIATQGLNVEYRKENGVSEKKN